MTGPDRRPDARPSSQPKRAARRHEGQLGTVAIWGWPIVLGVLTTIGLVSALFSDGGFGDLLAGVCLAVPVVVGVWYGWMRRRAG